jgi:hypothetical protein
MAAGDSFLMGKAKKIGIAAGIAAGAFFAIVIAIGVNVALENKPLAKVNQQEPVSNSQPDVTVGSGVQSFSPQHEKVMVVNGTIEVKAGGYVVYPITVPKGATNAQLSGNFTSSEDGINVVVMDGWKLDAWKEKQMTFNLGGVYYRSEAYVNSGTLQIPEAGGNWTGIGQPIFLIFDNTEDLARDKTVNANLTLSYTEYISK